MEKQFTATAYIIDRQEALLIYHLKLGKWLPPGGHMDPNELPSEAARREAKEETGLDIEFLRQENIWVNRWNANSFERPYMCLLEEIPAWADKPAHQHIDFIYAARPAGGEIIHNAAETGGVRWFTLKEIEELESDVMIYHETKEVLRHLLAPK
jgi:ADP-ribose pyrophosphatase YjhB (NUDIX family)